MTCPDCPHHCAERGPRSVCGIDQPGRVYWQGVTLLEEHALAPTYEIYFTGCSLRCRFCTVPDAIEQPTRGAWLEPQALVDGILAPDVPPFRTVSLVGGDPTVNRPYVDRLLPVLRARLPGVPLVLNTNLFLDPARAAEEARRFDVVVGDLHFWQPACARAVAGVRAYPQAARAAAQAVVAAGGRLILRVLVLPGHHACCTVPTVDWAQALAASAPDRVEVHVMTHYAPAGRARGHATLGRALSPAERQEALALLSADCPTPAAQPVAPPPPRPSTARDPAAPIEIDAAGRVLIPFVTGELLPLAVALEPALRDRLVYAQPEGQLGSSAATRTARASSKPPLPRG